MKRIIEYNSVFDAARGNRLLELYDEVPRIRDHDHGVLKFEVSDSHIKILRDNKVGFEILK